MLGLTSDERSLRFLAPDDLRIVGQIPLSSTNSLAARTAREKRLGSDQPFLGRASRLGLRRPCRSAEEQRGDPIQKIMSAPIQSGSKVIGVLQVSRKGKAMADAGADFTHPQLRELKTIADALGALRSAVQQGMELHRVAFRIANPALRSRNCNHQRCEMS